MCIRDRHYRKSKGKTEGDGEKNFLYQLYRTYERMVNFSEDGKYYSGSVVLFMRIRDVLLIMALGLRIFIGFWMVRQDRGVL